MPRGIYVLPMVGTGTNDDPHRPRYLYEQNSEGDYELRPEVVGYHGTETFERNSTDYQACLVDATTQAALDSLEGQSDAYHVDGQALATALNDTDTFPVDLTPKMWGLILSRVLALSTIFDEEA